MAVLPEQYDLLNTMVGSRMRWPEVVEFVGTLGDGLVGDFSELLEHQALQGPDPIVAEQARYALRHADRSRAARRARQAYALLIFLAMHREHLGVDGDGPLPPDPADLLRPYQATARLVVAPRHGSGLAAPALAYDAVGIVASPTCPEPLVLHWLAYATDAECQDLALLVEEQAIYGLDVEVHDVAAMTVAELAGTDAEGRTRYLTSIWTVVDRLRRLEGAAPMARTYTLTEAERVERACRGTDAMLAQVAAGRGEPPPAPVDREAHRAETRRLLGMYESDPERYSGPDGNQRFMQDLAADAVNRLVQRGR